MTKLLSIEAVAFQLDVSSRYVHELLTERGRMPYVVLPPGGKAKPGRGDIRVEPAALDAFIKRHTVPATSP